MPGMIIPGTEILDSGTLKLTWEPVQTVDGPLIGPGVEGAGTSVTASWLGELVPHVFPAVTATLPEVVPH